MWFGLAPSPAPNPSRLNSRASHPPSCTCARHRGANAQGHHHAAASPRHSMLSPRKQQEDCVHDDADSTLKRDLVRVSHLTALHGPTASPRAPRKQDEQQSAASIPRHPRHTLVSRKNMRQEQSALSLQIHDVGPRMVASVAQRDTEGDHTLEKEHESATSDRHQPEHAAADHMSFDMDGNNAMAIEFAHSVDKRLDTMRTPKAGRRVSRVLDCIPQPTVISNGDREAHSNVDTLEEPRAAPPRSRRSSRAATSLHHDPHLATDSASRGDRDLLVSFSFAFPHLQPENLVGHTSSVCFVATKDDRFLVSCSIDGSVKVWSRSTYACLHTLFGHKDNVSCIDLHSRWLVSGSHDTTLRVYNCLDNFRCLHVLRGHTAHITKVHLPLSLPQHILSCSDDATIRIWHGERGHCVISKNNYDYNNNNSNNNRTHRQLQQQTHKNNREIHATQAFYVHNATVQVLVATSSIEGTLLLSGSSDGTIHLFNFHTMDYIGQLDGVHSPIYSMCLLSHGRLVCSTGDGQLLQYSDLYSHPLEKSELKLAPVWISSLQLCGEMLVCSSEGLLYIVDVEQLRIHTVIDTMHGFINSVSWLHANTLISGGQDNVIKIWHIA
ncbi:Wd domain-containing protein, partial [Globisporangium splendens]